MDNCFRGDPEGKRLARRQAALLSEAQMIARTLEVLLRRAGYDPSLCRQLAQDIKQKELVQLQKSYGRVQSRKKIKNNSGHPLLEGRPTNCLFLDESGKSYPEPHLAESFFALGAISIEEENCNNYTTWADDIKMAFFGKKDITFHEPYMRNFEGPYYFNGDTAKQTAFDTALNELIVKTDFVAFGVGVHKTAFSREFIETGIDPYLPTDIYSLAITLLLERYVDYLAYRNGKRLGRLTFESQGPKEDAYHQLEYARLLLEGSQWVPDSTFRDWLMPGVGFTPKCHSHPTELADMLSRDLFEWVRSGCRQVPKRWHLFSQKAYCREDCQRGKFGIKVFPDSEIREWIEGHREQYGTKKLKSAST